MNISIRVDGQDSLRHAPNLKNFLEKSRITGLQDLKINRATGLKGEMGTGSLLDSITAAIQAAAQPLTELVRSLQVYFETFKTNIDISVGEKKIVINTSNPKKIEELVRLILKSQSS